MSTKLRVIFDLGNQNYLHGQSAVRYLKKLVLPFVPNESGFDWLNRAFDYYVSSYSTPNKRPAMWVIREPRGISVKRSRYKSLCKAIGIGVPIRSSDVVVPRLRIRRAEPRPAEPTPFSQLDLEARPIQVSPTARERTAAAMQAALGQQQQIGQSFYYQYVNNLNTLFTEGSGSTTTVWGSRTPAAPERPDDEF